MAAKCAIGEQSESLIMDTFVQNMNNKMVQQKLCTEPKDNPQKAFSFAVDYEEGISQHQTFESGRREIKNESVYAVTERKNPCTRFGLKFSQNHLALYKAKNEKCRNCATKGYYARRCKRPKVVMSGEEAILGRRAGMRRINLIEREDNQSEESNEQDEDNMVLHICGSDTLPFVMKSKTNNQPFTTMIDSGSPITIFTQADLREILKADVIFARPMPKSEQYFDYNNKPLNLLGFTNVNVKGKRTIKNARIVISKDGKRTLIGRDWLNQLNFRVGSANGIIEYPETIHHISEEQNIEQFEEKFPELFSRQGKFKGNKIKCEFRKDATITQQKARRTPLQRQDAVEDEIEILLKKLHQTGRQN